MNRKLISSKEVVEKFKISYPTLTHYTNIGLFRVIERRGNKRMYNENEIKKRLPRIRELINKGYPLRLIVEKLNKNELL